MKIRDWIGLLLRNFVIAAVLLGAIQWLKRDDLEYGVEFGLIWGAISALVFTGAQYNRWRGNIACALCEALPKRDGS